MADVTKREMARQRATLPQKARSKYGATKTAVYGWTFDSKAEARRYEELLVMGAAGWIRDLELQPSFPIIVCGVKVGTYRADFRYQCVDSDFDVIEDVKGMRTPVYRLKKKLIEAIYGFPIAEIR